MWFIEVAKLSCNVIGTYLNYIKKYDKDIIYINVNKKFLGEDERALEREIGKGGKHRVKIQTTNDKHMKLHLLRMKYVWKRINWSQKYSKTLYYTGCVSVPFSVFDGYMASDRSTVSFLENDKLNNKRYLLTTNFELVSSEMNYDVEESAEDINVFVYGYSKEPCLDKLPCRKSVVLDFKLKQNEVVTNEYLNKVYGECIELFDYLDSKNVKNIHLYVAARQSVAFTVGQAIQKHHPKVYCYEYENGSYTWKIDIKEGKIIK